MDWKFKENLDPIGDGEFWYDITIGGYIRPEELLDDEEQIKKLNEAINLVKSFEEALGESDLLEEV